MLDQIDDPVSKRVDQPVQRPQAVKVQVDLADVIDVKMLQLNGNQRLLRENVARSILPHSRLSK